MCVCVCVCVCACVCVCVYIDIGSAGRGDQEHLALLLPSCTHVGGVGLIYISAVLHARHVQEEEEEEEEHDALRHLNICLLRVVHPCTAHATASTAPRASAASASACCTTHADAWLLPARRLGHTLHPPRACVASACVRMLL